MHLESPISCCAPYCLSQRCSVNGRASIKQERITTTHLKSAFSASCRVQLTQVTNICTVQGQKFVQSAFDVVGKNNWTPEASDDNIVICAQALKQISRIEGE
jgi:hypothetical protein